MAFYSREDIRKRIRVGRRVENKDPSFPPFRKILCLTPSTAYGAISPYALKDDRGRIMENRWHSQKIHRKVRGVCVKYSQWDKRTIWQRSKEVHIIHRDLVKDLSTHIPIRGTDEYITPQYLKWREDLSNAQDAIRYPVGFEERKTCVGVLTDEELERFLSGEIPDVELVGYVESRKQVYIPLYRDLVLLHSLFEKLVKIAKKWCVLIVEVDGPHQETLPYYIEQYGVDSDFIDGNTTLATRENLDILLEDTTHPYGHGYVLADVLATRLEEEYK